MADWELFLIIIVIILWVQSHFALRRLKTELSQSRRNIAEIISELSQELVHIKKRLDSFDKAKSSDAKQETNAEKVLPSPETPEPERKAAEISAHAPESAPHVLTPVRQTSSATKVRVPPPPCESSVSPPSMKNEKPAHPKTRPKKIGYWQEKWREFLAEVDWELFTGVRLFAWIGGLALFVAAGFFVKYSIDRNLIPPGIRLAIGAVIGIGLILASFRFKAKQFTVMQHTLAAGGIGVLYTIIFAATLYYHFLPKPLGFSMLAMLSAATFVLAIYHNGAAISVLGALGAYATPVMVNTGSGNLILLFCYLSVVNIGAWQVWQRLNSDVLYIFATCGTIIVLYLGIIGTHPGPLLTAVCFGLNLMLFGFFTDRLANTQIPERASRLGVRITFLAPWLIGMALMIDTSHWSPVLLFSIASAAATFLALRNPEWHRDTVPHAALIFLGVLIWSLFRFDPQQATLAFGVLLIYGVVGSLGPAILMLRFGVGRADLTWLRLFPSALCILTFLAFIKNPVVSAWFWPLNIIIHMIGIAVSLAIGALAQLGFLVLLLCTGLIIWVFHLPWIFMSPFFFLVFGGVSLFFLVGCFFLIRTIPNLMKQLMPQELPADFTVKLTIPEEWLTILPGMGVFVVLGAAIGAHQLPTPHFAMLTLLGIMALSLYIGMRLRYANMIALVLVMTGAVQIILLIRTSLPESQIGLAIWAIAFFCGSVTLPRRFFADFTPWVKVWMGAALFEAAQGICITALAHKIWGAQIAGGMALAMTVLKLPEVARLLRKLSGHPFRNSITAFHGGVLLFYFTMVPVLFLNHGWIGAALALEAAALLWLNTRVPHEGLRWVSAIMAPTGFILVVLALPGMKHENMLPILNSAVMSLGMVTAALFAAAARADYPGRILFRRFDLKLYFYWLALISGFWLANTLVAEWFMPHRGIAWAVFRGHALQRVLYGLCWAGFGALMVRMFFNYRSLRFAGILVLLGGVGWLLVHPFWPARTVAHMVPIWNSGLLAYVPLAILLYTLQRWLACKKDGGGIEAFVVLWSLLITGFFAILVELTTVVVTGKNFAPFLDKSLIMAAASAAVWILYGSAMLILGSEALPSIRKGGIILILAGGGKAAILPFAYAEAFVRLTPVLNWPTLLFATILITLFFLLQNKPRHQWPLTFADQRVFWGIWLVVAAFWFMNVEIASFFMTGKQHFTFASQGNLGHQLSYSIGWLLFSVGLLVAGLRFKSRPVRWSALALLLVTAFKVFFMDLWKLGQLYRVASFVGLAVVLILVSFLYQKFLSDEKKNET